MKWEGVNGEVTRTEIETLLGDLQSTGVHLTNGQDNALSDGWLGMSAYASGLLFEITGDRRALDVAVRLADKCVSHLLPISTSLTVQHSMLATRNDPNTGRVMWTGKRELVWPTKSDTSRSATYAGCESMEVVRLASLD